ncbi:MAG: CARDB domain-containing protein [Pseudomonadota bacterium]
MKRLASSCVLFALISGVSAMAAQARDLPDLVVVGSDLRHSGSCDGSKPLIVGSVKVKNIGQGRGQIFTTKVMLQTRSQAINGLRGDDRFVNSMRPGEVVVVEAKIKTSGTIRVNGPVDIELTVDPVNVFAEENEANNTTKVTINVRCPD